LRCSRNEVTIYPELGERVVREVVMTRMRVAKYSD
jgi:hypothetical protein